MSVDRNRQVRLLGLGLLHGLLDLKSVRAVAEDPDPVEALESQGLLDPDDATALFRILDEDTRQSTANPSVSPGAAARADTEPPLLPTFPGMEGLSPWDSLPSAGTTSDGSGRHVLQVLTLPAWNKYRNLRFIAEGGMGRVFRAFDPSLKRVVALKFLRRDDPELMARFVMEAQHQAKVEHPNICRVYEVGEWQGQSYIAMQYIRGETLEAAIPTLSLEEKVRVIEAVAEAIHAAHRVDLIHRDLKPSNIMVIRQEQGLVPAILDFGLARGVDAAEFTQDGLAVGTIHYMAPEQVRGQHARINRQTDVYGLGATLHKILTGEAPFAAFDGVEAFRRTVETDVPPLRRLAPGLPEDLDTITRKCLEKDPARRYENALAVAEDLHRWLLGEPILARKPTLTYLITKWARRHKLVVVVAGAGILAALGLGSVAFVTASRARAQAQYAQHFGQEAERIEALLRYASLLPPHDVRPELAQARARMATLELEAQRAGRLAAGPSAYALGRSHLALGDSEKARQLLEAAWSGGLHTPEVALALGRALAASYQRELDLARALPSKELREARERELVWELRDPALARLREGASAALEAPAYQEALVAFMGSQLDGAKAKAQEALAATPWLFEAKRLEGDILLERAKQIQDPGQALGLLSQAEGAFEAARRLGPSDVEATLGEVRTLAEWTNRELAMGQTAKDSLARCREAVARAQRLRPDLGEAPARLAWVLAKWTEPMSLLRPATRQALLEADDLSRDAFRLNPEQPTVLATRILVLITLGKRNFSRQGLDPSPAYDEALNLARTGQRLHPQDPMFAVLVASVAMRKMTWEINTGTPPWASFEEGLGRSRALRNRFPDLAGVYLGLCTLWIERAEFERCHGLDPRASVVAALEAEAAAEARGLRLSDPGWTTGDAHLIRGEYLLATEGKGAEDFARAAEGYGRALRANPRLMTAHISLAAVAVDLAKLRLEAGQNPDTDMAEAKAHLALPEKGSQDWGQVGFLQGQVALLRGRQQLAAGRDPEPAWRQAETFFRQCGYSALALAQVGRAEAWGRLFLHHGRHQDHDQALASAREALRMDPLRAEAWLWIATVEQEAYRRGDQGAEDRAKAAWARTMALDVNLRRTALSLGMP